MSISNMNRRDFLKGCGAAAAASVAGTGMFFATPAQAAVSNDTIVHVFLRGGIDGLNLVVPIAGADRGFYEEARPDLQIAVSGSYAALPLALASGAQTGFGLHPSATGLRDLWVDSKLAIVQSCGMPTTVTRSHFDAQLYLDLGTPGLVGTGTGWITRAWAAQAGQAAQLPVLAVNSRQPNNMLGSTSALSMGTPSDFSLNRGAWAWQKWRDGMPVGTKGLNETLASLWNGSSQLEGDGRRADAALRLIASKTYADLPASWPTSDFARQLWVVAQTIRFGMGLRYAAVDLGGWDTHEGQGTAGSGYHYYQNRIAELSQALTAFYVEMAAGGEASRVTVVVQSEFGRRVRENASGGTDHGYGNPMLVLGGTVKGRRMLGTWSGLNPEILSPHFGDIPANTDFRQVLSELLIRRLGNHQLSSIFPGYSGYAPLNIVHGTDITPV